MKMANQPLQADPLRGLLNGNPVMLAKERAYVELDIMPMLT
jgi:hypothetical protein